MIAQIMRLAPGTEVFLKRHAYVGGHDGHTCAVGAHAYPPVTKIGQNPPRQAREQSHGGFFGQTLTACFLSKFLG